MAGGLDAHRLSTWLAGALDRPDAHAEDPVRLSGGSSRQTWATTVAGDRRRRHEVVVQCARRGSLTGSFEGEASLLAAAAAQGVPVPPVLAATDDEDVIGARAIAVDRLDGEAVARKLLRDERFTAARQVLVGQTAAALAGIHALDPTVAPHLRADDPVTQLRALHDAVGGDHPTFELAFRWLEAHRPEPVPAGIVHGDLRLGNLLVDEDGLVAVLDWELAHLGDPAEDLGWACVKAWRFGEARPALGLGTIDELLDAYEAAGGRRPGVERLRWWLVLGTLRWGVICELQVDQHRSGRTSSIDLAAIGRRVCETEHDLLGLLGLLEAVEPTGVDPDAVAPGPVPPHDVPSAAELVDALAAFLAEDLVAGDALTGKVRFDARVAANVAAMVGRELRLGPAQAVAHLERLHSLNVGSDLELANRIRDGAFDGKDVVLGPVLSAAVTDKLAVANPAYLATPPADPWRPVGRRR